MFSLSLVFTTEVNAESESDKANFLVDSAYDYNKRTNIDATLIKTSNNALFYIENDYYSSLDYAEKAEFDSDVNSLALNFDTVIYPKMRDIFGQEWNPGIDNINRITILFTQTKENVGGYFNPNDEYLKSEVVDDKSNEREMLYLNVMFVGNERIESFLAHEFQHMITWYHKTKLKNIIDDIWLNEGRSEYASTAIGYDNNYLKSNLRARAENFMQNQTESLTEWQNKVQDYSSVNLFSQYLADHYGGNIFKAMIGEESGGITSINKTLNDMGYTDKNFSDIFTNWVIANYINDENYQDGRFGYKNQNLTYANFHLKPTKSFSIDKDGNPINITESIKDWSSRYYEIKPLNNLSNNNISISFNGDDSGKFSVPYALFFGSNIVSINKSSMDKNQDGVIYVKNFGKDVTSIVIMPASEKKMSGFGNNNESYSFSVSINPISSPLYADGTLLKSYTNPDVYLIEDGKKRWITSSAALISNGYSWENIVYVNANELDFFERGENLVAKSLKPDGTLVRGTGPKVYLIENGKRRWITSGTAFVSKGYKWESIMIISDNELNSYPQGENISVSSRKPDGTLVRGTGPKVYLIENGKRRWITSGTAFVSKGYKWENIVIINDYELDSYEDGPDIKK